MTAASCGSRSPAGRPPELTPVAASMPSSPPSGPLDELAPRTVARCRSGCPAGDRASAGRAAGHDSQPGRPGRPSVPDVERRPRRRLRGEVRVVAGRGAVHPAWPGTSARPSATCCGAAKRASRCRTTGRPVPGSTTSPRDSANSASASGDPPRVKASFPGRAVPPPAQTRQIPGPNSCLTAMAVQRDPRRLGSASQINQCRAVRPDHVDSSTATPNGGYACAYSTRTNYVS